MRDSCPDKKAGREITVAATATRASERERDDPFYALPALLSHTPHSSIHKHTRTLSLAENPASCSYSPPGYDRALRSARRVSGL